MSLPQGWAEHVDPTSGNPYYHNTATGEVTWTRPTDGASPAAACAGGDGLNGGMGGMGMGQMGMQQPMGGQMGMQQPMGGQQQMGCMGGGQMGGMGGMDSMGQMGGMGGQMGGMGSQMGGMGGQMGGMGGQMGGMGGQMGGQMGGMGGQMGGMGGQMGGMGSQMGGMGGQMGGMGGQMGMGGMGSQMGGMGGQMGSMGGMDGMGGMGGMGGQMGGMGSMDGMNANMQTGTVKSWNDEKGFGFIVPNAGGDDIFVHRSSLVDGGILVQGNPVQFEVTWNAQKGKSQASRVTGAVPQPGKGWGKGDKGGHMGGCMGGCGGGPGGPGGLEGPPVQQSGTVKVWFEDKGFGFLTPDGGGDDCYVHRTALTDGQSLTQNAAVSYIAQWNAPKNKYTATSVTGATAGKGGGGGKGDFGGYVDPGYGKASEPNNIRAEPYETGAMPMPSF